ncbi:MAG: beta-N-acetylhexosaminidase [Deltaproteobacteria bacterium]|nr:beta-N-acetylhexosaminidase [Deltaproteobacteria bacterium]
MHSVAALLAGASILAWSTGGGAVELPRPGEPVDIDQIIASMSVEEKVGQLLMVGFGGTRVTPHIRFWVKMRHVGGVALFSRNIVDLEQTARFTRELMAVDDQQIPLFVALDQEGGNVVRVKQGAMVLPGNMALGATRSPTLAYVAGQGLAIDLRNLGFNMNLAPVLDVNSNPKNPVIGVRSYGERPDLVAELGAWYVRGQQEMGVVAVAKHFPGHGDTQSDSHFSMPSIDADLTRLESIELRPFKEAMDAGLDAVMTAHIAVPRIAESPHVPSTLSTTIIGEILRKRMGFNGVVITDGLEMQGIVEQYGSGKAAVLAILAGADMPMILWTPKKKEEVYQALLAAVVAGEITTARLDQSVRRILATKLKRGLFARAVEPLATVLEGGNRNPLHEQVATRIAREAVTLVKNNGEVLPLRSVRYRKVAVLAPPGPLANILAAEPNVEVLTVPYIPSRERRREDVSEAIAMARGADLLVMAVVNRYHVEMAKAVTKALPYLPVAVVSLASPYYLASIPDVDAYVCTYSYLEDAQIAAAQALLGRSPMVGRLPVTIPGLAPYGFRVPDPRDASPTVAAAVR